MCALLWCGIGGLAAGGPDVRDPQLRGAITLSPMVKRKKFRANIAMRMMTRLLNEAELLSTISPPLSELALMVQMKKRKANRCEKGGWES